MTYRLCLLLALASTFSACAKGRDVGNGTPGGTNDFGGTGGTGGADGGTGGSVDPGGGDTDGCSAAAKLIYLVDQDNTLYSFTPVPQNFTTIGTLNCPAQDDATPFSMGVDRSANAWVLYSSGEIFEVSTTDASCTATSHQVGADNMYNFGMGFATDSAGSTNDTLYIAGGPILQDGEQPKTATFATMSVPALQPASVGSVTGWPELTGNANGELWGFFPSDHNSTPRVAQLDKTSGADTMDYSFDSLSGDPAAWAFAYYGGNYYIFLALFDDLGDAGTTGVYQVDAAGNLSTLIADTGKTIVGAGVSTCAPTTIQ